MQKQIEIEYIAQQKNNKKAILLSSTTKQKFSRTFNSEVEALDYIKPYKKGDVVFVTSSIMDVQVGDKTYRNSVIEHISFKEPDDYVKTSTPTPPSTAGGNPNLDKIDKAIEEYMYAYDILESKNFLLKDEQAVNSQIATILIQAQKK